MTRILAGLCALLLLVGVAGAAGERVLPDPYHFVKETLVSDYHRPVCVDDGSDTLFGWDRTNLILEWYDGSSWGTVLDLSARTDAAEHMRRIFVDSNGVIFFSFIQGGKLFKVTREPYALADSLEYGDTTADFLHMAEDDSCLYVGEYDGNAGDTTARIWRSVDAGATWHPKHHDATADHSHGVWCDPYRDGTVYSTVGDGTANAEILKSTDFGLNWSSVLTGDCRAQATDILFFHDTRIFGMDCRVADRDSGGVFITTDDSAYTDALNLVGVHAAHIYGMAMNADSTGFAVTYRRNGTTGNIAMYRMSGCPENSGEWRRVALYEATSASGIPSMTEFDTAGNAYYADMVRAELYKFSDAPIFTVGTGGDFATLAAALADGRTAGTDTLVFLPGTHSVDDANIISGITLRGPTMDASDATLIVADTVSVGLSIGDAEDVTVKNLTIRGRYSGAKSAIKGITVGDVVLRNVRFQHCRGAQHVGLRIDTAADRIELRDCRVESCSSESADFSVVYIKNATDLIIDGLVAVDNTSDRPPFHLFQQAAMDTLIVKNSLFVNNTGTTDLGGAMLFRPHVDSAYHLIDHCTFDANDCGTEAHGQLNVYVADEVIVRHCIFANATSTFPIRNVANIQTLEHCNSWNNSRDAFAKSIEGGATVSDTLHVDPDYNKTGTYLSGWYQAQDNDVRDHANAHADYMGWELWEQGALKALGGKGRSQDGKVGHHR